MHYPAYVLSFRHNHYHMFRLDNKQAVITGGGSGIGAAISTVFAAQGATVHILDLNKEKAEETAQSIRDAGGMVEVQVINVTDRQAITDCFAAISKDARLDILVNNAGIGFVGNIEQTPEETLDRMYQVNIKGVYNGMQAAVPIMRSQGGGVILNMASIVATIGIPDRFAYTMTKGAVLGMTHAVAIDYLDAHIRCNCISPARVHTPFVDEFLAKNYPGREQEMMDVLAKTQPIGRMGKPEEIAYLALYLCSDEASFVTGTDYPIDGGFISLIK